jgi:HlyD family secretion protein
MKIRWLFVLSVIGALAGIGAAIYYARQRPPLPPVFQPAANPYATGIYANGIVESDQPSGANLNLYAEVSGTVARIAVQEGQAVKRGDVLIQIEDSVQRALTAQQQSQADAVDAQLNALLAQPRKEALEVTRAQVSAADAGLRTVQDQLDKLEAAARLNPKAVSRDAMDNAANAVRVAHGNLVVAQRQYDLTRAGAWSYDIRTLQKQRDALQKGAAAAAALLEKYAVRAPMDGVVMSVNTAMGGYVSPQGTYDAYTRANVPGRTNWPCVCMWMRFWCTAFRPARCRHACSCAAPMSACRWNLCACSRTCRPRFSCPTSAPNAWMCGCCRCFSVSSSLTSWPSIRANWSTSTCRGRRESGGVGDRRRACGSGLRRRAGFSCTAGAWRRSLSS